MYIRSSAGCRCRCRTLRHSAVHWSALAHLLPLLTRQSLLLLVTVLSRARPRSRELREGMPGSLAHCLVLRPVPGSIRAQSEERWHQSRTLSDMPSKNRTLCRIQRMHCPLHEGTRNRRSPTDKYVYEAVLRGCGPVCGRGTGPDERAGTPPQLPPDIPEAVDHHTCRPRYPKPEP